MAVLCIVDMERMLHYLDSIFIHMQPPAEDIALYCFISLLPQETKGKARGRSFKLLEALMMSQIIKIMIRFRFSQILPCFL